MHMYSSGFVLALVLINIPSLYLRSNFKSGSRAAPQLFDRRACMHAQCSMIKA